MTIQIARGSSSEALLQEHIRETFPSSLAGWLGKEHFWALGDMTAVRRAIAGELFMELCFPIKNRQKLGLRAETIDHSDLGLIVSQRSDVGLGYPPVQVATMSTSHRAYAHFQRKPGSSWLDVTPIASTVVKAGSVVEFAGNPDAQSRALFSRAALGALATFSSKLLELPAK